MPRAPFSRIPFGFVTCFATVLIVVVLAVPIPFGPRLVDGAPIPVYSAPTCLSLRDGRSSRESTVPRDVVLLDAPLPRTQAPANWHAAVLLPNHQVPNQGMWRFITGDSVEVRYHHSPSIRLATNRPQVSGVATPAGVSPTFMALFERPQGITGFRHPCSIPSARPPNER